jgi:hypothetical protein
VLENGNIKNNIYQSGNHPPSTPSVHPPPSFFSRSGPVKNGSGKNIFRIQGSKRHKKMVKKLLNISSWDPVLTCPEEDGADTVQAGVLCWLAAASSLSGAGKWKHKK